MQRKIADVAFPMAPQGMLPDCNYLSSSDLVRIAQAAISNIAASSVQSAAESLRYAIIAAERKKPFYVRWLEKLFPWLVRAESTQSALIELVEVENSENLRMRVLMSRVKLEESKGSSDLTPTASR